MKKRILSMLLALVMCLSLLPTVLAAKVNVTNMPGHEILSALPETLQRPARPTTLEQADVNRGLFGTKWEGGESVLQELTALTDSLIAGKTTDTQKMKAIYDWVSQNVKYDTTAYRYWLMSSAERTEEQSRRVGEATEPFHVYTKRLAICSGYTGLCWLMGAIAEIPVAYIHGVSNELNRGPHAWNAALVDGKWLFFDATWGEWDMAPNYHTSSGGFECYDGLYQLEGYRWEGENRIALVFRPGFQCPASVTIPSYTTEIGGDAFSSKFVDCASLKSVTIPDSVTKIGPMAFEGCTGLESINIPNGVTEIDNYVFSGCTSLKGIAIPHGVTRIWAHAFVNCTSLKSVTIPDSVTSVGQGAFSGCTDLESVTLGSGVTKEALDRVLAFDGCTSLKSITFSNGGTSIGTDEFFKIESGVLTKYSGYGGSVTIPEGVTEIGRSAFLGCANLTSVTFPNSLTKIGNSAFSSCTGLTSLTIPASVTSIEDSAFSYCSGLTSVTIPATVTEFGFNVFYACKGLKSVTIQDGVTKIGSAFGSCTGLTSVTIPGSVKNTGGAFYSCAGLTSVTIQKGVTEIGSSTFSDCTGLTSVTIPDGVTVIDNVAFRGCTNLKSVAIPASMTKINRLAFQNCTSLTDVYYGGTEDQWKAIKISKEENDALTSATIHYNSTAPETPAAGNTGFSDVPAGAYYENAVKWAVEKKITAGKTTTTFAPNENCTHAQILTFLWRAAGELESSAQPPIAMKGNEFYYKAVKWAAEKGMIGADFNPEADCTRAYAVLYIWQAFGKTAASYGGQFTDVPANAAYAQAVAWALATGVTAGATDTTFNPDKVCSRGEIVTFLYRAYR